MVKINQNFLLFLSTLTENPLLLYVLAFIVCLKLLSFCGYLVPASLCRQPNTGSKINGTNLYARGDGSMWNNVTNELVSFFCAFSSHSAALGIGKLFSSIPNKSSMVLPTPPSLFFLPVAIHPISRIFCNARIKPSFVYVLILHSNRRTMGFAVFFCLFCYLLLQIEDR